MHIRLQISTAKKNTQAWEGPGPLFRIGRDPAAEISLEGEEAATVSWEHALIEFRPDGAYLCDRSATNGTFLNDVRVASEALLRAGDRINLGHRGPELTIEQIDLSAAPAAVDTDEPTAIDDDQHGVTPAAVPVRPSMLVRLQQTSESVPAWLAGLLVVGILTPILLIAAILVSSRDSAAPLGSTDLDTGKSTIASATEKQSTEQAFVIPLETNEYNTPAETAAPANPSARGNPALPSNTREEEALNESAEEQPALAADGASPAVSELAIRAKDLLQRKCYDCHGSDGSNEGGFNFVLHHARLIDSGHVIPSNPDESYLFQRVTDGEMPPDEEFALNDAEVAVLRDWITVGAPDFNPARSSEFVSTPQVLEQIAADLEETAPRDRRFIRFFTITHLHNAGASDDELQTYRNALAKLVNSLSWKRDIAIPRAIDQEKTILRIDLRDYRWTRDVWDRIVALNPYGVVYSSETAEQIAALAETRLPFVRGDWFVFRASRPPLYEAVLQLPVTDRELEKMLMVNVEQNILQETAVRAGFNASGVSQNNRLIERHESTYGAYWKSYDFAENTGRQNLFEHPLGPAGLTPPAARIEPFSPAGGELIFSLPNGLQGYLLVDERGNRIERGPTKIVSDPNQPDRTVVNGISCMSCHFAGIIEKSDEIRGHILSNRDAFPEADEILALYPPQNRLSELMENDAARFRRAVEATGSKITRSGEPVVNMARRFEEELDLRLAAAELGMTPAEFSSQLKDHNSLRRVLGQLVVPGRTVKREVFAQEFRKVAVAFRLGEPLARPVSAIRRGNNR